MESSITVRHDAEAHRFEAVVDGHLSVCEYEITGTKMVFTHTLVPSALQGRGIAEILVRAGLAEARAKGCRVVPACSYVAKFVERHAEYRDVVAP